MLSLIILNVVSIVVFNIKSQEARIVHLTPNDTWGGAGLLGVTIRLDNYAGAEDRFIRVLSVVENGPAAVSGLLNDGTDFILGTTHHTINSLSHFAQLLHDNIDRIIELYVYNSNTDIVRVVTLMPSYEWNTKSGGTGLFGAEVGTGYLHRLPYRSRSTSGKCVERKVRYVPAATEANQKVVLLEDAPQMEMEPPDTDDDDDENVEEVYNEPKRDIKAPEQVSGSGTAEENSNTPSLMEHVVASEISMHDESNTKVTVATTESAVPNLDQIPPQEQALSPQIRSNTTAAAAIFGQPLVPPPPPVRQNPSSTIPPDVSSLGPPPPRAYQYGTSSSSSSSSFAPPVVSYAPPSTTQPHPPYYYGGPHQQQNAAAAVATGNSGHFSYSVPPPNVMMPPPPVGGVWNHSTSSNQ